MLAWQFAKAQHAAQLHGWTPFSCAQNHYNLLYREEEREMIPQCRDMGVGLLPWSPLARGLLAGSRTRDGQRRTLRSKTDPYADQLYGDADFDVVAALDQAAARIGRPPAQVALAWLVNKPGVTAPIVGATKAQHIDDAVAALHITITEADMRQLEAPYRPHPVLPPR
jgi:aryl-alcohol dehydrogenase-like predicted oxidoreductase